MNELRRVILNEVLGQINAAARRIDEIHAKEFRDMSAIPDQIENSVFGEHQKDPLNNLAHAVLKLEEAAAHVAAAIIHKPQTEVDICLG